MKLHRIEAEPVIGGDVRVGVYHGVAPIVDEVAERADPAHRFLRAGWYRAAAHASTTTLVARRADGTLIAALPTAPIGPPLIGMRGVAGSYWPFRSIALDAGVTDTELAAMFAAPVAIDSLGPAWRIGPIYARDPVTLRIKRAAAMAGWTVLTRELGNSFLFDVADPDGWPRRSTRRRLSNYERQLSQQGEVRIDHVTGSDWTPEILNALAAVEAASWVGTSTDGSGAKFLCGDKRAGWLEAISDPVLANALSATILSVGGLPAAFSFDLQCGAIQYGIASSYDECFAAFRPGKIVTAYQVEQARAAGVTTIDLGAGDSGYKREMGAVTGPAILDLLVVRNRSAASLLKLRWGAESQIARDAYLAAAKVRDQGRERRGDRRRLEALIAVGALAAAAMTLAE